MNSQLRLSEVDLDWLRFNDNWVNDYFNVYDNLKMQHTQYSKGWGVNALHPHRFIPRLFWYFYRQNHGLFITNPVILDIGTYDGTLVKALRNAGFEANGEDEVLWPEMWKILDIEQLINKTVRPDVVCCFNHAHRRHPEEFLADVLGRFGKEVNIWCDREQRTPHKNNSYWMNNNLLATLGFEISKFPKISELCIDTQRDLLIRRAR